MTKSKIIRGCVEIHAETHWAPRVDGVSELVVDAWRVQHRDGSVEFAMTPQAALGLVMAFHDRARHKAERRNPNAAIAWVTTIEWRNAPIGFEPPTFEVKS